MDEKNVRKYLVSPYTNMRLPITLFFVYLGRFAFWCMAAWNLLPHDVNQRSIVTGGYT